MLVNGKKFTTIWFDKKNECVKIIDQRLLPHELKIIDLNELNDVLYAIKEMQVRGAPLIGVSAAYGMFLAAKNDTSIEYLIESGDKLIETRPTAVNLSWAVNKIINKIKDLDESNRKETILNIANNIREEDIQVCSKIGDNGLKIIKEIYNKKKSTINILTHCNAGWLATVDWGTALSPIFKAKINNIPIHVWVDETRPRNQGFSLTAWELINENISNSLIVDNVGGYLMQQQKVDLCITGTDRLASNGDVCNKIGTYLKALAAYDNKIPFYVSAPISSIDFNILNGIQDIPIEERSGEEVSHIEGLDEKNMITKVKIVPDGATCVNYAFDVTPAKYITKLITEKGIIDANSSSINKIKN